MEMYHNSEKRHDNIVIVDEDKDNAKLLGYILEFGEHNVYFAKDFEEIEKFSINNSVIIILYNLSKRNQEEYDLLKAINTSSQTCHIPVLVLSSFYKDEIKKGIIELYADKFLTMPINKKEILNIVQELTDCYK